MDFINLIDFFIVGIGLYVLYSAYVWKSTGVMKKGFLISGALDLKACKDMKGYIDFMAVRAGIFGVVIVIYGLLGIVNTYLVKIHEIILAVSMFIFLGCLVWFSVVSTKGAKKFF